MDIKDIERLARLVSELDLGEIEVRRFGKTVRISRLIAAPTAYASRDMVGMPPAVSGEQEKAMELPAPDSDKSVTETAAPRSELTTIKAPMVGTFYRSPAPDAPPYVEVGHILQPGQTICIIEAMKIMNEINSEIRGKVVSIDVENAQPVEFGTVLMVVDTSIKA